MQRAGSFEPLFVNEKGQQYRFYIWDCPERKRVKELIEVRHGKITKNPVGDYTIQLADPKTRISGEVYSIYYIIECCSLGTLLDLRNYRINSTSKYSAAFHPMHVLQGLITWEDADVFRLEHDDFLNKDIPLSAASSKRRKVSGAFSTDEELEITEQINASVDSRQKKNHSSRQQTSSRDINVLRRKRRRSPYKLTEKEAIVQYLKAHKAYKAIKGTAIWKNMEEDQVCGNRTWQSLKEHFLKHILPFAETFDFSTSEVALLKKVTSHSRRKDGGENNTSVEDSDDDIASLSGNRYTPEEDEAILKYISCDRRYLRAGGIKIWQRMERKQIAPGRSWQSLKERYRKNLAHRLDTYVNKGELNRMHTWIKGSSRSTKDCSCCSKSRSPVSTPSSANTSITSMSSELSTGNSLPHKRKLFTQHKSPVQFTPVSVNLQRPKVPGILTLAKQTTSCMNDIQCLPGNNVQYKTAAGSSNSKGNVIRKEVVLAAKKKVGKYTACVENKEKATPTVRTQLDKQQVRTSSSSSSTENSVAGICGTPGEDISDKQEVRTSSLSPSTENSVAGMNDIQCLPGNNVQYKTAAGSSNCKGNVIRKEVVLAAKKKVGKYTACVENKEKATPTVRTQLDKQQVRTSSSSSSTENSVAGICGTPGEDISDKQEVRTSSLSPSTENSVAGICGTPGEKDISDKLQVRTSSSSCTEISIGSCDTPGEKDICDEQQVKTSSSSCNREISVGIYDTPGEDISDKQQVRTSSSSSSTEISIGSYDTPGEKDISVKQQVRTSSLLSSTEISVGSYDTLGDKDISDKQQVRTSSLSPRETSVVGICGTIGEDISEKQLTRTSPSPSRESSGGAPEEDISDKQQVRTFSSSPLRETPVIGTCVTPGEKDINTVSKTSCTSESQKCISSTSSDAGLGTSLTDINKESVPSYDQSAAANENTSECSNMPQTIPEIMPSNTACETDPENSVHESDPCLQEMAGTSTQDSQSSMVEVTANMSSSSGASEGTDSDCSPKKKGSVLLRNYTSDRLQDGAGSESSSVETHLHDEQLRKPKTRDASCLEALSCTDTARVDDVNAASASLKSSKHYNKRKPLHCNYPVALTPLSGTKHKTPQPKVKLLDKNIEFMYGENAATINTSSDSTKRRKKKICNKSKKHKDYTVGSKEKIIAPKVEAIAERPEKCSKLGKPNMDKDKEKDHLKSLETSSVRNVSNRVADKSLKHFLPYTSLDSFISEYISKSQQRNMSKSNMEDRKRTSDDKTSSGQHKETGGTQAILSCSKNSHTYYSTKSNHETGTSMQGKETTLSSNHGILFRKTKQKQKSSFKDKMKSCQMKVTEDMSGIPDDTNSVVLHMKLHEAEAPPSCFKPANYSTESNLASTSIQEKEASHSNTQDVQSRKIKHVQKHSFKDVKKSHQTSITDVRKKVIRRHKKKSLKSNKNISKITASNNNLHKEDITILDMIEIIPKEMICESTESSQEILSEHSETWTDPDKTAHVLISSRDIKKNYSCSIPGKNASENITNAVQVCEISNSNVDMIQTQETNSSVNSKSSTCEVVSLSVHNSHSSLNSSAPVSLIHKNAPSVMFKKCPRQSTEKPVSVLCDESDNEAGHTNMPQKTLQCPGTIVLETPEDTMNDTSQTP